MSAVFAGRPRLEGEGHTNRTGRSLAVACCGDGLYRRLVGGGGGCMVEPSGAGGVEKLRWSSGSERWIGRWAGTQRDVVVGKEGRW